MPGGYSEAAHTAAGLVHGQGPEWGIMGGFTF